MIMGGSRPILSADEILKQHPDAYKSDSTVLLPGLPSPDMASTDTNILQAIGNDLVQTFAAIVVETFFLAIYIVLVIQASRVLIRKGLTRVPLITLIALLVMFGMALVMWGFDITNFVHEVQITLIRDPEAPLDAKYGVALKEVFHLAAVLNALYSYMSILGDAIVVWRVYALWGRTTRRWVVLLPLGLLFGSFLVSIVLTYCVARLGTEIIDGSFQKPAFCKNIQTTSYAMAVATTAVATILIGLKTWEYRRSIKPMVSSITTGRSTRVERVMILFVESGVLYFLFFLVEVIGNIPGVETNPSMRFAFLVYSFSTSVVVGIYPTALIILAHSEIAVLDSAVASTLTPSTGAFKFSSSAQGGVSTKRTNDIELFRVTADSHSQKEGKSMIPL